ncbi:MAG: cation diffusion facilitator family transporter [Bacteriovoracaceae bacterium]|jgi:cation diffusion facilitator family transporter
MKNPTGRLASFYHNLASEDILNVLEKIALPGVLQETVSIDEKEVPGKTPSVEGKTLKYLLVINLTMFFVEIIFGIYADSTGLLADGLDMFADSLVYTLSLYAVGRSLSVKNKAAFFSGVTQVLLGLLCIIEVGRRFYFGSEPLSNYMIVISIIALLANVWCLALIHKHKDGEVHMKASWIFSANDVIVNTGVIVSGVFVYFFNSNIPDLVIGGVVAFVVIRGGITIIKLSRSSNEITTDKKNCCS